MHDCMHLQSNTDKQACTCTKTHIHSLALTYTNTYTGSSLTLALFHSCKHTHTNSHTHTHTLSEEARWSHSVGCWPFTLWRLDFSLFLFLHRPLFLSSLIPLTLFLLHALIYVNTLHLVFSFVQPFHFVLRF